jgi:hypothetical protein
MSPVLNWPPIAVKVWVVESLLVTLIVVPGDTVSFMGENMKFEMVIAVPLADEPDDEAPVAPLDAGVLLQAPRSRAPAITSTPAPKRTRRTVPQTAMDVGLKASGVPLEL